MLPDGYSAFDVPKLLEEQGIKPEPAPMPQMGPDGATILTPEGALSVFYHECGDEVQAWAETKVTPEPIAPLM
jgi:hypothetical protein